MPSRNEPMLDIWITTENRVSLLSGLCSISSHSPLFLQYGLPPSLSVLHLSLSTSITIPLRQIFRYPERSAPTSLARRRRLVTTLQLVRQRIEPRSRLRALGTKELREAGKFLPCSSTSSKVDRSASRRLLVRDTVTIGSSTVASQDVVAQEVIGSSVAGRASDG